MKVKAREPYIKGDEHTNKMKNMKNITSGFGFLHLRGFLRTFLTSSSALS